MKASITSWIPFFWF